VNIGPRALEDEVKMLRIKDALLVALMVFGVAACSPKAGGTMTQDDMDLGNPQSKVTVVEYASVGCPVCAKWQKEVFPAFKTKYIDSNKVHYVFREMLVGNGGELSMGAAGFMMARCLGKDKYFPVLDTIFHQQEAIYKTGDLRGGLLKIAQSMGMNEKQFTDCVSNPDGLAAMNARNEKAGADGVNSTPTFFINGKRAFEGVPTPVQLDDAMKEAGA
jgi:protein-disulfide isomerase